MSHPLLNAENISWLTGRRAGAKGSASFSWISYWKLVSLGQPVLPDTESVAVYVSSLGTGDQRRGAWSISYDPTVHLEEQGTEGGHDPPGGTPGSVLGGAGPGELPRLCLLPWDITRTASVSLRDTELCLIRILSEISRSFHWERFGAKSFFLCLINILPLWR